MNNTQNKVHMKKKFTLSLLFLVLSVALCYSKQLSENDARSIATSFMKKSTAIQPSSSTLKLAYVGKKMSNTDNGLLYVFNKGLRNGYVIIAGDDRVKNEVLGYSDNGEFDYSQIPENMKYWLSEYERQIEYMQKNSIEEKSVETKELTTSVAPLLGNIKWGQDSPYNLLCPSLANGRKVAAGCVATAMAQIMYYWRWPEVGNGSHSYGWDYNNKVTTLTADFSSSKYRWDLMMPSYDENSSNESQLAVAKLLSDVGISVNMDYGASSSAFTSDAVDALKAYFKYDKNVNNLGRISFSSNEWEQILKEELDEGRPVLYSGQSSGGGHAFVCDGYNNDGYFHFNWGWDGLYDGYFLTTWLDPVNYGNDEIKEGYNYYQGMIVGIQPIADNSESKGYVNITSWSLLKPECEVGGSININVTQIHSAYSNTMNFDFALNLYKDEELICSELIVSRKVDPLIAFGNFDIQFDMPNDLQDGEYRIYPQYKLMGEPETSYRNIRTPKGLPDYIKLNVTNGKIKAEFAGVYKINCVSLTTEKKVIKNRIFRIFSKLENQGDDEYWGHFYVKCFNSSNNEISKTDNIGVLIPPGQTDSVVFEMAAIPDIGNYILKIYDQNDNVLGSKTIYTQSATDPVLSITQELSPESYEMLCTDIKATAKIKNTGGYFNGYIELMIYADNNIYRRFYDYVTLDFYEEKTLMFNGSFDNCVIGKEYNMALRRYDVTNKSQVWGTQVKFKLKAEQSAIDDVEKGGCAVYPNPAENFVRIDSEVPIVQANIFTISGTEVLRQVYTGESNVNLDVTSLASGMYLLRITKEDGTNEVLKLKKK